MNVNLSQSVVETIAYFQKYPMFQSCIEDVENFIIDNIDVEKNNEEKMSEVSIEIINHLKFLRKLRDLLRKFQEQDEQD